jgi:hypothetical protein
MPCWSSGLFFAEDQIFLLEIEHMCEVSEL